MPGFTKVQPRQVGDALRRALGSVQRWSTHHRPRGTALTVTDVWLLERLAERPHTRMSDLAAWNRVDRSTITAHVKRLADAGWVARGADPADRRAVTAEITPEGRARLEAYCSAESEILTSLLGDWPDDDVAELTRLLTRFAAELDAAGPPLPAGR